MDEDTKPTNDFAVVHVGAFLFKCNYPCQACSMAKAFRCAATFLEENEFANEWVQEPDNNPDPTLEQIGFTSGEIAEFITDVYGFMMKNGCRYAYDPDLEKWTIRPLELFSFPSGLGPDDLVDKEDEEES